MSVYVVPIHKDWHRLERCGLDIRFCYGFVGFGYDLIGWFAHSDAQTGIELVEEVIDNSMDGPIFYGFLSREPGSLPPLPILIALMEGST
jgi:hypothetical protein